jgi:hypothetical protein
VRHQSTAVAIDLLPLGAPLSTYRGQCKASIVQVVSSTGQRRGFNSLSLSLSLWERVGVRVTRATKTPWLNIVANQAT